MIGVIMRIQHRVNQADLFPQQLDPKFRCRIDQQVSSRKPQNCGASRPIILGVAALANVTRTTDRGNSDARARAKQDETATNIS